MLCCRANALHGRVEDDRVPGHAADGRSGRHDQSGTLHQRFVHARFLQAIITINVDQSILSIYKLVRVR